MKIILEFNDDERSQAELAMKAMDLYSARTDALNRIRNLIKYDDRLSEETVKYLEEIRNILDEVYFEEN